MYINDVMLGPYTKTPTNIIECYIVCVYSNIRVVLTSEIHVLVNIVCKHKNVFVNLCILYSI